MTYSQAAHAAKRWRFSNTLFCCATEHSFCTRCSLYSRKKARQCDLRVLLYRREFSSVKTESRDNRDANFSRRESPCEVRRSNEIAESCDIFPENRRDVYRATAKSRRRSRKVENLLRAAPREIHMQVTQLRDVTPAQKKTFPALSLSPLRRESSRECPVVLVAPRASRAHQRERTPDPNLFLFKMEKFLRERREERWHCGALENT